MATGKFMLNRLVILVLALLVLPVVLSLAVQWRGTGVEYLDKASGIIERYQDPRKGKTLEEFSCDEFNIITSKLEFINLLTAMRVGFCGEDMEVSDGSGMGKRMLVEIYPPSRLPGSKDGLDNQGISCTAAREHYYYCLDAQPTKGCFVIDGYNEDRVSMSREEHEQEQYGSWLKDSYSCEALESVIFPSYIGLEPISSDINVITMVQGRTLVSNNKLVAGNFENDKITFNSPYTLYTGGCSYATAHSITTGNSFLQASPQDEKLGIFCGIESYMGTYEKWCSLTKGKYIVYSIPTKNSLLVSFLGPPSYQGIEETAQGHLTTSKCL